MYTYVIIDDEPLIRRGTKKKLEPLSHLLTCCGEASDGREGLELVRQLKPDIVILDMQMPVMDGTELLPALSEEFPSTALIVISGFQNFDYMKQAISSKVIDYILKPFSKDEIQQTVLKTIDSLKDKEAEDHHLTSMVQEKEEAFYSLDLKLLTDFLLGYTDTAHSSVSSQKLSFINEMHHFVLLTLYSLPEQDPLPVQNWLERNGFTDLALYLPDGNTPSFHFLIVFLPETSADSAVSNRLLRQFFKRFSSVAGTFSCLSTGWDQRSSQRSFETAHCLYGVPGSTEYAACRYFPYRQFFLLSAFRSTFFYQLGKTGRIPFSYRIRRRRGCPGDGRRTVFLLSYTHSLYTLGCEMPLRTADVSLSYGFKLLSEKN